MAPQCQHHSTAWQRSEKCCRAVSDWKTLRASRMGCAVAPAPTALTGPGHAASPGYLPVTCTCSWLQMFPAMHDNQRVCAASSWVHAHRGCSRNDRTYCCNVELLHAWQLPHGSRCSCHLLPQHPLQPRRQVDDFYQVWLHPIVCIRLSVDPSETPALHCLLGRHAGNARMTHPARHEHQPVVSRVVHQQHGAKVQSHDLFGATQSYVKTSVAKPHQPKT